MISDDELYKLIKKAFVKDERLSLQPIVISVKEGVVTLSGEVLTYRRKLVAQEVASSFEGCRDVTNDLEVNPKSLITDEEITTNVRAALDSHADIEKETIVVSVSHGVVTLNGNVGSNWERIVAEDVALSVRGVKDVSNCIIVNLTDHIEDKTLEEDVKESLSSARGLKDSKINVAVSDGLIVLTGEVPSFSQKDMAGKVAGRFRLWEIRNDLVISD